MTFSSSNVADLKASLRRLAKDRRRDLAVDPARAAHQAADNFIRSILGDGAGIVAGYAAYLSELDVWPLLHRLHRQGQKCCLPILRGPAQPLAFGYWHPKLAMAPNQHGIAEPAAIEEDLAPDIVLTPLLAFDRRGYRLGYGGGYYDRTLQGLRAQGKVLAVGFGYEGQEIDKVPAEELDAPLDWIVTEQEVIRVER